MNNFDAVIIGGGASGIMCAIAAKQKNPDAKIAIIEKNERIGKKLLSTGNGRCNLTNQNIDIKKYRGSFAKQADFIFKKYTTERLIDIFSGIGLVTYADSEGRYYPLCRQASAVLDVMRYSCDRLQIPVFANQNIRAIKKQKGKFSVKTDSDEFISDKLVIACGSKASPKLGGNASGIDYLKNFGHTAVSFSPALCPIKVKSDILKSLKGIRTVALVTLKDANGKTIKTDLGEVQFAENSLSGICIFNLSVYAEKNYSIQLDILPDFSYNEIYNILLNQKELFAEQTVDNIFTGILQKRLAQAVLKMSGITGFSQKCSEISEKEIKAICATVKSMNFTVLCKEDFDKAQCALGGIIGKEINEKTMESKIVKGLYLTGEVIDICGECGGFNLHFAFSTGHLAGESL